MRRRAWTLIAAGTAIYWGWLIAASAIFEDNAPDLAIAWGVPLVLATLILPVAAAWAASVRRFSRHPEAVREPVDMRLGRGWVEQAIRAAATSSVEQAGSTRSPRQEDHEPLSTQSSAAR